MMCAVCGVKYFRLTLMLSKRCSSHRHQQYATVLSDQRLAQQLTSEADPESFREFHDWRHLQLK
jgi:hypothetical protein